MSAELACQVVPDIPTFAVDDGFTYLIPPELPVTVGSVVRVRVSGRRRRGFVTAVFPRPKDRKLLPVDSISGDRPTFDEELLEACRRVALHYVAPLSTVLSRTVPPNVPRMSRKGATKEDPPADVRTGGVPRIEVIASRAPHHRTVIDVLETHGPAQVIVPTGEEAHALADELSATASRPVVVATSAMSNAAVTTAWSRAAADRDTILVGTRETMLWTSVHRNGFIVVEDGRRVMKSPATPTMHARDVAAIRAERSGTRLTIVSPVPTLESLSVAQDVHYPPGRLWGPIEVVDRTEEPPGSALLTFRVRHAIGLAVQDRQSVFILVANRGYAPAFKCRKCGELRRCGVCSAALTPAHACRRCGSTVGPCQTCGGREMIPLGAGIGRVAEDIRRFVDPDRVGVAGEGRVVTVGSERDLVGLTDVGLGVVVDIDGMLGAPHYRAAEDTIRLVARLAQSATTRQGRTIIQTSDPDHPAIHTLVSGHPQKFLTEELAVRKQAGFPPSGQLVAIEVRDGDDDTDRRLREAVVEPASIRGPAEMRDRKRWLVQGSDLGETRLGLRSAVGALRNSGAKVRVDVDPIDL